MTLEMALTWASGLGAGVVAAILLRHLDAREWWKGLRPDHKRYLVFVATAIVACAAYSVMVAFAYQVRPVSSQAWAEALFAVSASAIAAGQVAHGATDLRRK